MNNKSNIQITPDAHPALKKPSATAHEHKIPIDIKAIGNAYFITFRFRLVK